MRQKKKVFFFPVKVKELTIHTTHHKLKKKKNKNKKNKNKTKQNKKSFTLDTGERGSLCPNFPSLWQKTFRNIYSIYKYIYIYYLELFILNSSFSILC